MFYSEIRNSYEKGLYIQEVHWNNTVSYGDDEDYCYYILIAIYKSFNKHKNSFSENKNFVEQ